MFVHSKYKINPMYSNAWWACNLQPWFHEICLKNNISKVFPWELFFFVPLLVRCDTIALLFACVGCWQNNLAYSTRSLWLKGQCCRYLWHTNTCRHNYMYLNLIWLRISHELLQFFLFRQHFWILNFSLLEFLKISMANLCFFFGKCLNPPTENCIEGRTAKDARHCLFRFFYLLWLLHPKSINA